jgi:hypothetical protein
MSLFATILVLVGWVIFGFACVAILGYTVKRTEIIMERNGECHVHAIDALVNQNEMLQAQNAVLRSHNKQLVEFTANASSEIRRIRKIAESVREKNSSGAARTGMDYILAAASKEEFQLPALTPNGQEVTSSAFDHND